MRFQEAWRLSKTPYSELTFRSAMMARGSTRGGIGYGSPGARVRSIMRGALVAKVIFAGFIGGATAYTMAQYLRDRTATNLVSAITFSLAITLAYVVLYSLQVLPSFSSAEAYIVLSTLPLSESELSLLTILSIVRTFDLVVAAAIVAQVVMVAYITSSVLATVAMALAGMANAVFGVAVSLWLSGLFQKNITRGGRGKAAGIARFVFLISWGLAAASLGFLFNVVSYAIPALDSAVSGAFSSTDVPVLFSLIHPFTAGIMIASIVFPSFRSLTPSLGLASLVSPFAFVVYLVLSVVAARRALALAGAVAHGPTVTVVRQRAAEFLLRIRRPIPAYVLKDVRVSSKNPSSAFIYALPVLETLVVFFSVSGAKELHSITILASTFLASFLTLVSATVLLNTEGSGLDYTLSLPLSARVMVLAKSMIATVAYLPVPVAIWVLLAVSGSLSPWLYLIPLVEIAAIFAATSALLSFFIQRYKRAGVRQTSSGIETRGMNLMSAGDLPRLGAAFGVAFALVGLPIAAYGAGYLFFLDHFRALGAMALVALAELAFIQLYLRKA